MSIAKIYNFSTLSFYRFILFSTSFTSTRSFFSASLFSFYFYFICQRVHTKKKWKVHIWNQQQPNRTAKKITFGTFFTIHNIWWRWRIHFKFLYFVIIFFLSLLLFVDGVEIQWCYVMDNNKLRLVHIFFYFSDVFFSFILWIVKENEAKEILFKM